MRGCSARRASSARVSARSGRRRRPAPCVEDVADVPRQSPYRPWAELLKRTFGFNVLACPRCEGAACVCSPWSPTQERRALPACSRQAHRGADANACASSAVLAEPRPAQSGDRRRRCRVTRATSAAPREGSVRSLRSASRLRLRQLRRDPSDLRTQRHSAELQPPVPHREPHSRRITRLIHLRSDSLKVLPASSRC